LVAFRQRTTRRAPGLWRSKVRMAADFDSTPEELVARLEG
jgi:hypothetical protein